jgi:hypothetical protein
MIDKAYLAEMIARKGIAMERHGISPQTSRTTQIVKQCCHIRHEIAISANRFIPVPISDARS